MNSYLIVAAFIVLDFVTGLAKAFATHSFSSTKMREGLWHKTSLVLVVILGILVDYAQGYLELGVSLPVAGAVCAYISLMEISSIVENACQICPDMMPDKLAALFGGLKRSGNGGDDHAETGD